MRQADLLFNILTAAALGIVIVLACDHVHARDRGNSLYSSLPGKSENDAGRDFAWVRACNLRSVGLNHKF
jgi:predicted outer membrane lipoprotein